MEYVNRENAGQSTAQTLMGVISSSSQYIGRTCQWSVNSRCIWVQLMKTLFVVVRGHANVFHIWNFWNCFKDVSALNSSIWIWTFPYTFEKTLRLTSNSTSEKAYIPLNLNPYHNHSVVFSSRCFSMRRLLTILLNHKMSWESKLGPLRLPRPIRSVPYF